MSGFDLLGGGRKRKGKTATTKLNSLLQEEKDRNDVVLKEFPVFLSKTLLEQLCLIQYPQRPSSVSTDNMHIVETKIKPGQKKIQLSLEMDPESELYDPESAELLAEAAEGLGLDEDQYMPDVRLRLEKTTMESTTVPRIADLSRYAIGVVRRGAVTLTPITSIVQMKTIFPYLNKADKARTAFQREKSGAGDLEDNAAAAGGDQAEAEKVTVKFSRNTASGGGAGATTSSASSRATSSYMARKKEEEEPWVELDYVGNDPTEFDKLYTTSPSSPFYVLNKTEYLDYLFPKHLETCSDGRSGGSIFAVGGSGSDKEKDKAEKDKSATAKQQGMNQRISLLQMKTMTVPEQLKVLLSNAKVLSYNQIVDFLKSKLKAEFDDASLLKSIQIVGILVQGCWVVRSEIIYPEDFKSGCNGISGAVMQRGRDAILSQFTENRFVERKRMMSLTKLPADEVLEILTQVSVLVRGKGWEFILPYDTNFLGRFPEVVERQSLIWQMKKQKRIRHSSSITTTGGGGGSGTSPPSRRRRSRNKSISSSGGDDESGLDSDGQRRRGRLGGGGGMLGASRRNSERESDGGGRQRRNSNRSNVVGSKVET